MMKGWTGFFAVIALSAQSAFAVGFDLGDLSDLTDAAAKSLLETAVVGADYRPMNPASPLGLAFGLDLSISLNLVQLPSEVQDALKLATDNDDIVAMIPLPRFDIHKGFPFGLDAGFSYIGYQDNKLVGGALKWAFLRNRTIAPDMAVQVTGSFTDLFFMKARTYKLDLLASKRFAFIFNPYIALGVLKGSGELDVDIHVSGLSASVSKQHSFTTGHFAIGLPITLMFIRFTAEYDRSFSGFNTYSGKVTLAL